MAKSEVQDIAVVIRHETEKAYLLFDGTTEGWVPKSQVQNNNDGTFTIPQWLIDKNRFDVTGTGTRKVNHTATAMRDAPPPSRGNSELEKQLTTATPGERPPWEDDPPLTAAAVATQAATIWPRWHTRLAKLTGTLALRTNKISEAEVRHMISELKAVAAEMERAVQ